ncbi:unnamed protein product [Fraxinus pennsylvanica]|uniref:Uncharacterized protein n=1 Tax=Fraxinus pennsylvanica TaxID=56036 RepID=A0AAD2A236_9LAMI|nr:unnamed protein product [Fraxinus pennsylvanica]
MGVKLIFMLCHEMLGAIKGNNLANRTCRDVWTEYHDMGIGGVKAVADYKAYTASSILDLLHFVAWKMMKRGDVIFRMGLQMIWMIKNMTITNIGHMPWKQNGLDDREQIYLVSISLAIPFLLPMAPDMEMFSMYGVGIPTERAYVNKFSPAAECYNLFRLIRQLRVEMMALV